MQEVLWGKYSRLHNTDSQGLHHKILMLCVILQFRISKFEGFKTFGSQFKHIFKKPSVIKVLKILHLNFIHTQSSYPKEEFFTF